MEMRENLCEIDLINEDYSLIKENKDIYMINTKIILQLLLKPSTTEMLYDNIEATRHMILLCLNRLLKKNVIRVKENIIKDCKLENVYELVSKDINLLSKYTNKGENNSILAIESGVNNISNITRTIMNNINKDSTKPNNIKAIFIKIDSKKISEFKKELDELICKFQNLENLNDEEVYGFINVLGPYS